MSINKFQRSRLTSSRSAKLNVAHIGVPSIYSKFFPETNRNIELKFHMKTPYDSLASLYTNCFGHITKMDAMSI